MWESFNVFYFFCIEAPELPSQDTIHLFFNFIFFGLLQGKTKPFTLPSTSFPLSLNLTKTTVDMAKELAAKAKEAFVDDDFDVAVDLYSKAIDLDPNCAEFFADRAQANVKLEHFIGNFFAT